MYGGSRRATSSTSPRRTCRRVGRQEGHEHQVERRARHQGLRRPDHRRRQDLHRHQQRQAARPDHHGRQGRPDVLRRSDGKFLWQAVHDKLPAGRVNDWPRRGHLLQPRRRGQSALLRQQSLRGRLRRHRRRRAARNKIRLEAGHDRQTGRLPAQPGRLLAADRRRHPVRRHRQRRRRGPHQHSPARTRRASWPSTRRTGKVLWQDNAPSAGAGRRRARAAPEVNIQKLVNDGKC